MSAQPKPSIDICSGCGKLYARAVVRLCQRCATSDDKRFDLVKGFLRENRGASISDVASYTGLNRGAIAAFYDQGRLVTSTADPGSRTASLREQLQKRGELQPLGGAPSEDDSERVRYVRRQNRLGDC